MLEIASDEFCYIRRSRGIHANFYADSISAMSNDQGILVVGGPHGGLGIFWNKSLGDSICSVKYEQDSCIIMGLKFENNIKKCHIKMLIVNYILFLFFKSIHKTL